MIMSTSGDYEDSLRKKITRDVVLEIIEEKRSQHERDREKHEQLHTETEANNKAVLKKLQQDFPLYSIGTTFYQTKFGYKTHKKNTTFSKPLSEQYEGMFKIE